MKVTFSIAVFWKILQKKVKIMDYKLLPGIEILSLHLTAFVVSRAVETSCLEAGLPLRKAMVFTDAEMCKLKCNC